MNAHPTELFYDHDKDVTVDIYNDESATSQHKKDEEYVTPASRRQRKAAAVSSTKSEQDSRISQLSNKTTEEGKWLKVKKNPSKSLVTDSSSKVSANLQDKEFDELQMDTPTVNLFSKICAVSNQKDESDHSSDSDSKSTGTYRLVSQTGRHSPTNANSDDLNQPTVQFTSETVSPRRVSKRSRRSFVTDTPVNVGQPVGLTPAKKLARKGRSGGHVITPDCDIINEAPETTTPCDADRLAMDHGNVTPMSAAVDGTAVGSGLAHTVFTAGSAIPMAVCNTASICANAVYTVSSAAMQASGAAMPDNVRTFLMDTVISPIQNAFSPSRMEERTDNSASNTETKPVKELSFDDL